MFKSISVAVRQIYAQVKEKGPTAKRSVPFNKASPSDNDKNDETVVQIKQELNKDETEQHQPQKPKPGALSLKPLSSLMAPAPASVKAAKKNQSAAAAEMAPPSSPPALPCIPGKAAAKGSPALPGSIHAPVDPGKYLFVYASCAFRQVPIPKLIRA